MAYRVAVEMNWPDVDVATFTRALNAQIGLVREVMVEMGLSADSVRWVISELRDGSAFGGAEPLVLNNEVSDSEIDLAIARSAQGFSTLDQTSERPPYFNDDALDACRQLANLTTPPDSGVGRLRFANVDDIVTGRLRSIGSIEGTLNGIKTAKSGYEIVVMDRLRKRSVQCTLPRALRQLALDAFEKRVIVRGVIWSRRDGFPQRIEGLTLEVVPADSELPTPAAMRGFLVGYRLADGE